MEGTIKRWLSGKGYGFIEAEGEDKDVFVHHSEIQSTGYVDLREGQKVSFDLKQDSRGPKAVNVKLVE